MSRVAKGGIWLAAGSSVEQVMRLVRNIILTRLLVPEMFGTMSILLAVNTFFESLSQVGIKEAVIKDEHGREERFLNAAWYFAFARGILLYGCGYLSAPYIAAFYENPELTRMLRLIFLSLFLRGAISIRAYVAIKDLQFSRWVLIEQTGGVIGIATAILLSFHHRSVYVLVAGYLAEAAAKTILSYIVCPYVPRPKFRKQYVESLLHFMRGMVGIPIFTFIFLRADVFFLGKMISGAQLGIYSIALSFAQLPSLFFQKFISPLFMPTFSEIKGDVDRVKRSITRLATVFGLIGFPVLVFIYFFGDSVLNALYTPAYASAWMVLSLLFTSYYLKSINTSIVSLYLSFSQPGLLRLFTMMRSVLLVVLLYPAIRFLGPNGAAASVLLSMFVSFLLQVALLKRLISLPMGRYWFALMKPAAYALPVLAAGVLRIVLRIDGVWTSIGLGVSAMSVSYALSTYRLIGEKRRTDV